MNYELIKERAEVIFDCIEERIHYGYEMDSPYLIDAYKAAFALKNKSVAQYCRAFRDSGLEFSITSVEAIYEEFSNQFEGHKGLSWQEKELLQELLTLIKRRGPKSLSLI